MTEQIKDGGPAFPNSLDDGMTLRDYFAVQALNGLTSNLEDFLTEEFANKFARQSYLIADAMLDARANND